MPRGSNLVVFVVVDEIRLGAPGVRTTFEVALARRVALGDSPTSLEDSPTSASPFPGATQHAMATSNVVLGCLASWDLGRPTKEDLDCPSRQSCPKHVRIVLPYFFCF